MNLILAYLAGMASAVAVMAVCIIGLAVTIKGWL